MILRVSASLMAKATLANRSRFGISAFARQHAAARGAAHHGPATPALRPESRALERNDVWFLRLEWSHSSSRPLRESVLPAGQCGFDHDVSAASDDGASPRAR